MSSDADGANPAEAATGSDQPASQPDDDGPVDDHSDATPGAEAPTEVVATGRPSVFVLLTCGFLACLCCVGGVFAGGSVVWMRIMNLEAALNDLGAPSGWEESSRGTPNPWSAEATVSGPSDAQAVTEWLAGAGAKADEDEVDGCLSSRDLCEVKFTAAGFPVTVEYGSGGEQAHATIHID